MQFKKYILVLISITLIGCAKSGYTKFYFQEAEENYLDRIEPLEKPQRPTLYKTGNVYKDVAQWLSKGYLVIGYSSFNGTYEDTEHAIRKAIELKATEVIVSLNYTETVTSTRTVMTPAFQNSTHSGTIYSQDGMVNYTGNSNSTIFVPITKISQHQRYNQDAIYLAKLKKGTFKLGIRFGNLSDSDRQQLKRNTGIHVGFVMEGSVAFYNDILPHDIIIQIDGIKVMDQYHATEIVKSLTKPIVEFKIIRDGEEKVLNVDFTLTGSNKG